MPRINRSKYKFSELAVGGSFPISPLDLYSMKNSLAFFNKKHGKSVVVECKEFYDEDEKDTKVEVTRIS